MKVVQVYQTDPFGKGQGGGVRYVKNLVDGLCNCVDVEHLLFLGAGQRAQKKGVLDFRPVVSSDKVGYIWFGLHLFKYAIQRKLLKDAVIHVHRSYFGIPFILFRWFTGCKVVCSLHGRTFEVFKNNSDVGLLKSLFILLMKFIERFALRRMDYLAPVSTDVVSSFVERYPYLEHELAAKSQIVPCMVNMDFNSEQERLDENFILFLGRLSDVKDVDFLLDVVSSNQSFFGEKQISFFICGDGELSQSLRSRVSLEGLSEIVSFKGEVEPGEALRYIRGARAVLISSKHEAGPTVAFESILLGTPIVTVKVGEMPEVFQDGNYGALVDKTPEAFMDGIKAVLTSNGIAEVDRLKFSSSRSVEAVTTQYLNIYRRFL